MGSNMANKTGISANKLFHIPELLELIPFTVSRIDLFVCHRVSNTFNATIHNSPSLQHKLLSAMVSRDLKEKTYPPQLPIPTPKDARSAQRAIAAYEHAEQCKYISSLFRCRTQIWDILNGKCESN
jgi:hypothetical protein